MDTGLMFTQVKMCEPAREGVRTFNISIDCRSLIAGKPAPTGSVSFTDYVIATTSVGAWLARDSVSGSNTALDASEPV